MKQIPEILPLPKTILVKPDLSLFRSLSLSLFLSLIFFMGIILASCSTESSIVDDMTEVPNVIDTTAPTLTCPANVMVTTMTATATATWDDATVEDNIDDTSLVPTYSIDDGSGGMTTITSGSMFPMGGTIVTATAIDTAENSGSCTFTVTVTSNARPVLTCPGDIIMEALLDETMAAVTWADATVEDSVDGVSLVPTYSIDDGSGGMTTITSGSMFPMGVTTVTATDIAGNSETCTFMVTVIGFVTLVCPDSITSITLLSTDPSGSPVDLNLLTTPLVTVSGDTTDTAVVLGIRYDADPSNSLTVGVGGGATSITAIVIDSITGVEITRSQTGNSLVCEPVMVTVNELAIENCPEANSADITIAGSEASWIAPTLLSSETPLMIDRITGGDDPVSTDYSSTTHSITFPAKDTSVTYTISYMGVPDDFMGVPDDFDRFVECTFEISIIEEVPPVFDNCETGTTVSNHNAPDDSDSITLTAADIGFTATDLAEMVPVTYETLGSFPIGSTSVTATATDLAGNTALCTFMVIVTDVTAPNIVCPDGDITYTISGSSASVTEVATEFIDTGITATDNSGEVEFTYVPEVVQKGVATSVMVTAKDPSDKVSPTCSFMVTIMSAILPSDSLFSLEMNGDPPSETNPFLIYDENDLSNLAMVVNSNSSYNINNVTGIYATATYQLVQNIIVARGTTGMDETVMVGESNFTPIGTILSNFQGVFDGNSNTISGLRFNDPSTANVGFFGYASSATIRDITLENVNITGSNTVGGLVGSMEGGSLTNASAVGSVTGSDNVGGLVGLLHLNSSITTASASGSVTGKNRVGGLVGWATNSSSLNTASASVSVTGETQVGGLVGFVNDDSSLIDVSASGFVTGESQVGGLVGVMNASSSLTYATVSGDVRATGGSGRIGGLVGHVASSEIAYVTASGSVTGTTSVGGLVGYVLSNSSITNAIASVSVTGTTRVGGLVGWITNNSSITNAAASGSVTGTARVGGLVGDAEVADITNAIAWGSVSLSSGSSTDIGGLVGHLDMISTIIDSYWDTETTGETAIDASSGSTGEDTYRGYTTDELQDLTDYSGLYANWNTDFDNNGVGDDPWDFVDADSYPMPRVSRSSQ